MACRIFIMLSFLLLSFPLGYCEEQPAREAEQKFAGEFSAFGVKVPVENYYFVKGAIGIFGNKWGAPAQTSEELEEQIWEQLLLSYESFRREINVEQKEFEDELEKMLNSEKVTFKWRDDKKAYSDWIKERAGEPVELFENQLRHMMQLQKLRQQVMDGIKPEVREEEAYQEFLNEWNTLSVELAQFDKIEEAEGFYKKVKNKVKLWERETKKNPKLFRRPGFVAAEFLMEMWKFPRDEIYKMLKQDIGDIYPPIPIYGGKYGVLKILEKRLAEESRFPELRKSYYSQIEMKKKYEGLQDWIKKLKDEAKIKVFIVRGETKKD